MDRRERGVAAEDPGSRRVLARRRRRLLWSFLALVVVVAVAVGAVVFMRSRRGPSDAEVASTVRAAIEAAVERGTSTTASAPSGGPSDTATGVDTKALRTSLETSLDGWIVDLATDDARTRVGVAARRLDDPVCVFAWSDVGASTSAIVTDPSLPCVATVALAVAKPAA